MPEYFSEAELRALPQMSSAATYTDARIEAAAAYVVAIIERFVGTSFVPRTVLDEVHDGGGYSIVLDSANVIEVLSATEDGVAVTDSLSVRGGVVRKYAAGSSTPGLWSTGSRNVEVTYLAGYSVTPPADIKEAALKATRAYLLETNSNATIDDRRTSINTDVGTIGFVIAGEDRPTGYPQVDAVLLGWRSKLDVFGFA